MPEQILFAAPIDKALVALTIDPRINWVEFRLKYLTWIADPGTPTYRLPVPIRPTASDITKHTPPIYERIPMLRFRRTRVVIAPSGYICEDPEGVEIYLLDA